jgi:Mn-containing catalase
VNTEHLAGILRDFHRDKLTQRQRHVAVARLVGDYDANNTYQYVIAREDVHLQWLEAALAELGAGPDAVDEPALQPLGRKESFTPLAAQDARDADAFVQRWRPRLQEMTHARHRGMMQVVLGETLEHKRFFDQIVAGREDVLGRRANGPGSPGTGDGVIAVRWLG